MSACQHSLGRSATNRFNELFGRFWGWRVTKPRALSTRKMVETDGDTRVALRQVVVDGRRTGVEAVVGQRLVHGHDLVLVEVGDPGRGRLRPPRPWLQSGGSFEAVAAQQLEEPARHSRRGPPPTP